MTKVEYLLVCLMEECSELQKEASKAIRFGIDNKWNREPSSVDKMQQEFIDVRAVYELVKEECDKQDVYVTDCDSVSIKEMIQKKKDKVLNLMHFAVAVCSIGDSVSVKPHNGSKMRFGKITQMDEYTFIVTYVGERHYETFNFQDIGKWVFIQDRKNNTVYSEE
jgi:ribosome maturation factor RimP